MEKSKLPKMYQQKNQISSAEGVNEVGLVKKVAYSIAYDCPSQSEKGLINPIAYDCPPQSEKGLINPIAYDCPPQSEKGLINPIAYDYPPQSEKGLINPIVYDAPQQKEKKLVNPITYDKPITNKIIGTENISDISSINEISLSEIDVLADAIIKGNAVGKAKFYDCTKINTMYQREAQVYILDQENVVVELGTNLVYKKKEKTEIMADFFIEFLYQKVKIEEML